MKFDLNFDKIQTDIYKKLANKAKEFLQNHKQLMANTQVCVKIDFTI
jgi:hypothetical protein